MSPVADRLPDGRCSYTAEFLSHTEADRLLAGLLALPDWGRDAVRMFGREHAAPRLTAWYGDPGAAYRYSGVTRHPLPWPAVLSPLRTRLEHAVGVRFNSVLVNQYRDGRDSLGWHSDDERDLGDEPVIASISVGAPRRFLLRHRSRSDVETVEYLLGHGSLLVMGGAMQKYWRHRVPKSAACKEPRVNLTFRRVLVPASARASDSV